MWAERASYCFGFAVATDVPRLGRSPHNARGFDGSRVTDVCDVLVKQCSILMTRPRSCRPTYAGLIRQLCPCGSGQLDADTVVSDGSYEAALHAAEGGTRADRGRVAAGRDSARCDPQDITGRQSSSTGTSVTARSPARLPGREMRPRGFLWPVSPRRASVDREGFGVKDVTEVDRRNVGRAADVSVLDLDPALGAGIEQDEWQKARRACRGRVLRLARGKCDPSATFGDVQKILASVIVDGLVWREVAVLDHALIELLGPGDVLQVTVADGSPRLGPWTTVIASAGTDLVVLDESFVRAAAHWPTLLVAVGARLEQQRERLAVQGLISHLSRAEHRLLLMLWHLAQRWGYRSPQGTVLGLRLTHDLLGQVIAAQRPTVTVAAGVLESRGLIGRLDDRSWLLTPMGERAVEEILARRATTISRGEEFVLDMILSETRDQAHAVRAQSAQARAAARRDSRLNGQSGRQTSIS